MIEDWRGLTVGIDRFGNTGNPTVNGTEFDVKVVEFATDTWAVPGLVIRFAGTVACRSAEL